VRRSYDRAVKVPAPLVEELARVTTRAQAVWREARKTNDFALFRPHLETIVGLLRQKADAIGHHGVRYDALLDEYEPGATTAQITTLFAALRKDLVPLIAAIAASGRKPRRELLEREYPVDRQRIFGESAAAALGFDFEAGRLDETTHPFCSGIGPGDCRITTRYNVRHFNESFFGILHETGHGLYEQGLPAAHATNRSRACGRTRSAAAGRSGSTSSRAHARRFPSPWPTCRWTTGCSPLTTCSHRSSGSRPTRRPTTCTSSFASSWSRR
jgi:carboxypeptidase Taq